MKQWPAGVNFRFDEVTENDIPRIQDIKAISNSWLYKESYEIRNESFQR